MGALAVTGAPPFVARLRAGRVLVGMVHLGALPGTPRAAETPAAIADRAATEARAYAEAGFDAVLVENMHDVPYLRRAVGPEIVAAMTLACMRVRDAVRIPVGVQVLAGANVAALGIAHACGLEFIRAEGFVFAAVADEGLLEEADAGPLLRERRRLGAEGVAILADVKKKHGAHAITADVDLPATVRAAAFFGADAVVVTGAATGDPTPLAALGDARSAAGAMPVLAGSGVVPDTLPEVLARAAGAIVGSSAKRDGRWDAPVDPARLGDLVRARDGSF